MGRTHVHPCFRRSVSRKGVVIDGNDQPRRVDPHAVGEGNRQSHDQTGQQYDSASECKVS